MLEAALAGSRGEDGEKFDELCAHIRQEWAAKTVAPVVVETARAIIERFDAARVDGVVFYGSCLRTGELIDRVLDFYVILDDYQAYGNRFLAVANKILPPNVFYHEWVYEGQVIRSKYAVISRRDLAFRTSETCLNVSLWARFCQPNLLLLTNSEREAACARSIAQAIITMLWHSYPLFTGGGDDQNWSKALWTKAFEQTYSAELRSEKKDKGLELYQLDQARYESLAPLLRPLLERKAHNEKLSPARARRHWWRRRMNGKWVSFLRLIKASVTFDGGIDYLAWKISRHSGVKIEIKDWMRRHPVIAGLFLFWQLRAKGAFR